MRIIDADEAVRTLKRMAKDCIFTGKLQEGEEYAIAASVLNRGKLADELSGRDINNHIRQLEAQVPKWISVKTPPKKPGEYIVLIRYPDGRSIRTFNIFHPDAGWCPNDLVEAVQTHWMSFYSLPEPPKEDNHAENDRS